MDRAFRISETVEHGVAVTLDDDELADEFDDFLTEHCHGLFDVKFEEPGMTFFFGQAGSVAKVESLLEKFYAARAA